MAKRYYEKDADFRRLMDKTIAIIGYGVTRMFSFSDQAIVELILYDCPSKAIVTSSYRGDNAASSDSFPIRREKHHLRVVTRAIRLIQPGEAIRLGSDRDVLLRRSGIFSPSLPSLIPPLIDNTHPRSQLH